MIRPKLATIRIDENYVLAEWRKLCKIGQEIYPELYTPAVVFTQAQREHWAERQREVRAAQRSNKL